VNETKIGIATKVALLVFLAAWATPARASCSNSTLKGDYGFTITGQILGGPLAGPVTGVAITHFDGAGNLTQEDFVVHNGVAGTSFQTGETGTYTVNSDCTGSAVINIPSSPAINLMFVVVKRGKEIRTVVSNSGVNITSIGTRIDWPF
jgi:hypothetical protein